VGDREVSDATVDRFHPVDTTVGDSELSEYAAVEYRIGGFANEIRVSDSDTSESVTDRTRDVVYESLDVEADIPTDVDRFHPVDVQADDGGKSVGLTTVRTRDTFASGLDADRDETAVDRFRAANLRAKERDDSQYIGVLYRIGGFANEIGSVDSELAGSEVNSIVERTRLVENTVADRDISSGTVGRYRPVEANAADRTRGVKAAQRTRDVRGVGYDRGTSVSDLNRTRTTVPEAALDRDSSRYPVERLHEVDVTVGDRTDSSVAFDRKRDAQSNSAESDTSSYIAAVYRVGLDVVADSDDGVSTVDRLHVVDNEIAERDTSIAESTRTRDVVPDVAPDRGVAAGLANTRTRSVAETADDVDSTQFDLKRDTTIQHDAVDRELADATVDRLHEVDRNVLDTDAGVSLPLTRTRTPVVEAIGTDESEYIGAVLRASLNAESLDTAAALTLDRDTDIQIEAAETELASATVDRTRDVTGLGEDGDFGVPDAREFRKIRVAVRDRGNTTPDLIRTRTTLPDAALDTDADETAVERFHEVDVESDGRDASSAQVDRYEPLSPDAVGRDASEFEAIYYRTEVTSSDVGGGVTTVDRRRDSDIESADTEVGDAPVTRKRDISVEAGLDTGLSVGLAVDRLHQTEVVVEDVASSEIEYQRDRVASFETAQDTDKAVQFTLGRFHPVDVESDERDIASSAIKIITTFIQTQDLGDREQSVSLPTVRTRDVFGDAADRTSGVKAAQRTRNIVAVGYDREGASVELDRTRTVVPDAALDADRHETAVTRTRDTVSTAEGSDRSIGIATDRYHPLSLRATERDNSQFVAVEYRVGGFDNIIEAADRDVADAAVDRLHEVDVTVGDSESAISVLGRFRSVDTDSIESDLAVGYALDRQHGTEITASDTDQDESVIGRSRVTVSIGKDRGLSEFAAVEYQIGGFANQIGSADVDSTSVEFDRFRVSSITASDADQNEIEYTRKRDVFGNALDRTRGVKQAQRERDVVGVGYDRGDASLDLTRKRTTNPEKALDTDRDESAVARLHSVDVTAGDSDVAESDLDRIHSVDQVSVGTDQSEFISAVYRLDETAGGSDSSELTVDRLHQVELDAFDSGLSEVQYTRTRDILDVSLDRGVASGIANIRTRSIACSSSDGEGVSFELIRSRSVATESDDGDTSTGIFDRLHRVEYNAEDVVAGVSTPLARTRDQLVEAAETDESAYISAVLRASVDTRDRDGESITVARQNDIDTNAADVDVADGVVDRTRATIAVGQDGDFGVPDAREFRKLRVAVDDADSCVFDVDRTRTTVADATFDAEAAQMAADRIHYVDVESDGRGSSSVQMDRYEPLSPDATERDISEFEAIYYRIEATGVDSDVGVTALNRTRDMFAESFDTDSKVTPLTRKRSVLIGDASDADRSVEIANDRLRRMEALGEGTDSSEIGYRRERVASYETAKDVFSAVSSSVNRLHPVDVESAERGVSDGSVDRLTPLSNDVTDVDQSEYVAAEYRIGVDAADSNKFVQKIPGLERKLFSRLADDEVPASDTELSADLIQRTRGVFAEAADRTSGVRKVQRLRKMVGIGYDRDTSDPVYQRERAFEFDAAQDTDQKVTAVSRLERITPTIQDRDVAGSDGFTRQRDDITTSTLDVDQSEFAGVFYRTELVGDDSGNGSTDLGRTRDVSGSGIGSDSGTQAVGRNRPLSVDPEADSDTGASAVGRTRDLDLVTSDTDSGSVGIGRNRPVDPDAFEADSSEYIAVVYRPRVDANEADAADLPTSRTRDLSVTVSDLDSGSPEIARNRSVTAIGADRTRGVKEAQRTRDVVGIGYDRERGDAEYARKRTTIASGQDTGSGNPIVGRLHPVDVESSESDTASSTVGRLHATDVDVGDSDNAEYTALYYRIKVESTIDADSASTVATSRLDEIDANGVDTDQSASATDRTRSARVAGVVDSDRSAQSTARNRSPSITAQDRGSFSFDVDRRRDIAELVDAVDADKGATQLARKRDTKATASGTDESVGIDLSQKRDSAVVSVDADVSDFIAAVYRPTVETVDADLGSIRADRLTRISASSQDSDIAQSEIGRLRPIEDIAADRTSGVRSVQRTRRVIGIGYDRGRSDIATEGSTEIQYNVADSDVGSSILGRLEVVNPDVIDADTASGSTQRARDISDSSFDTDQSEYVAAVVRFISQSIDADVGSTEFGRARTTTATGLDSGSLEVPTERNRDTFAQGSNSDLASDATARSRDLEIEAADVGQIDVQLRRTRNGQIEGADSDAPQITLNRLRSVSSNASSADAVQFELERDRDINYSSFDVGTSEYVAAVYRPEFTATGRDTADSTVIRSRDIDTNSVDTHAQPIEIARFRSVDAIGRDRTRGVKAAQRTRDVIGIGYDRGSSKYKLGRGLQVDSVGIDSSEYVAVVYRSEVDTQDADAIDVVTQRKRSVAVSDIVDSDRSSGIAERFHPVSVSSVEADLSVGIENERSRSLSVECKDTEVGSLQPDLRLTRDMDALDSGVSSSDLGRFTGIEIQSDDVDVSGDLLVNRARDLQPEMLETAASAVQIARFRTTDENASDEQKGGQIENERLHVVSTVASDVALSSIEMTRVRDDVGVGAAQSIAIASDTTDGSVVFDRTRSTDLNATDLVAGVVTDVSRLSEIETISADGSDSEYVAIEYRIGGYANNIESTDLDDSSIEKDRLRDIESNAFGRDTGDSAAVDRTRGIDALGKDRTNGLEEYIRTRDTVGIGYDRTESDSVATNRTRNITAQSVDVDTATSVFERTRDTPVDAGVDIDLSDDIATGRLHSTSVDAIDSSRSEFVGVEYRIGGFSNNIFVVDAERSTTTLERTDSVLSESIDVDSASGAVDRKLDIELACKDSERSIQIVTNRQRDAGIIASGTDVSDGIGIIRVRGSIEVNAYEQDTTREIQQLDRYRPLDQNAADTDADTDDYDLNRVRSDLASTGRDTDADVTQLTRIEPLNPEVVDADQSVKSGEYIRTRNLSDLNCVDSNGTDVDIGRFRDLSYKTPQDVDIGSDAVVDRLRKADVQSLENDSASPAFGRNRPLNADAKGADSAGFGVTYYIESAFVGDTDNAQSRIFVGSLPLTIHPGVDVGASDPVSKRTRTTGFEVQIRTDNSELSNALERQHKVDITCGDADRCTNLIGQASVAKFGETQFGTSVFGGGNVRSIITSASDREQSPFSIDTFERKPSLLASGQAPTGRGGGFDVGGIDGVVIDRDLTQLVLAAKDIDESDVNPGLPARIETNAEGVDKASSIAASGRTRKLETTALDSDLRSDVVVTRVRDDIAVSDSGDTDTSGYGILNVLLKTIESADSGNVVDSRVERLHSVESDTVDVDGVQQDIEFDRKRVLTGYDEKLEVPDDYERPDEPNNVGSIFIFASGSDTEQGAGDIFIPEPTTIAQTDTSIADDRGVSSIRASGIRFDPESRDADNAQSTYASTTVKWVADDRDTGAESATVDRVREFVYDGGDNDGRSGFEGIELELIPIPSQFIGGAQDADISSRSPPLPIFDELVVSLDRDHTVDIGTADDRETAVDSPVSRLRRILYELEETNEAGQVIESRFTQVSEIKDGDDSSPVFDRQHDIAESFNAGSDTSGYAFDRSRGIAHTSQDANSAGGYETKRTREIGITAADRDAVRLDLDLLVRATASDSDRGVIPSTRKRVVDPEAADNSLATHQLTRKLNIEYQIETAIDDSVAQIETKRTISNTAVDSTVSNQTTVDRLRNVDATVADQDISDGLAVEYRLGCAVDDSQQSNASVVRDTPLTVDVIDIGSSTDSITIDRSFELDAESADRTSGVYANQRQTNVVGVSYDRGAGEAGTDRERFAQNTSNNIDRATGLGVVYRSDVNASDSTISDSQLLRETEIQRPLTVDLSAESITDIARNRSVSGTGSDLDTADMPVTVLEPIVVSASDSDTADAQVGLLEEVAVSATDADTADTPVGLLEEIAVSASDSDIAENLDVDLLEEMAVSATDIDTAENLDSSRLRATTAESEDTERSISVSVERVHSIDITASDADTGSDLPLDLLVGMGSSDSSSSSTVVTRTRNVTASGSDSGVFDTAVGRFRGSEVTSTDADGDATAPLDRVEILDPVNEDAGKGSITLGRFRTVTASAENTDVSGGAVDRIRPVDVASSDITVGEIPLPQAELVGLTVSTEIDEEAAELEELDIDLDVYNRSTVNQELSVSVETEKTQIADEDISVEPDQTVATVRWQVPFGTVSGGSTDVTITASTSEDSFSRTITVYQLGDATHSGSLSAAIATQILREDNFLLDPATNKFNPQGADIDADGVVTASDVTQLLRKDNFLLDPTEGPYTGGDGS
jgi:hypothetical protein